MRVKLLKWYCFGWLTLLLSWPVLANEVNKMNEVNKANEVCDCSLEKAAIKKDGEMLIQFKATDFCDGMSEEEKQDQTIALILEIYEFHAKNSECCPKVEGIDSRVKLMFKHRDKDMKDDDWINDKQFYIHVHKKYCPKNPWLRFFF